MKLLDKISALPEHVQAALLSDILALKDAEARERAERDFQFFVKQMWPGFIYGRHHKIMAAKFQEIAEGKLKRLIIAKDVPRPSDIITLLSFALATAFKSFGNFPNA